MVDNGSGLLPVSYHPQGKGTDRDLHEIQEILSESIFQKHSFYRYFQMWRRVSKYGILITIYHYWTNNKTTVRPYLKEIIALTPNRVYN